MSITLIDKYTIKYSSNLFPRSINLLSGLKNAGTLLFHANASALPADRVAGDHVVLNYHLEDFENVLHILRTEKPVYLMYTGPGRGDENGIVTKDPDEPMMSEKISKGKKAK